MSEKLPLIGVPMGDPSGIGPEIIIKALAGEKVYECSRPVVIGIPAVFERALACLRACGGDGNACGDEGIVCDGDGNACGDEGTCGGVRINVISNPEEGDFKKGVINVIDIEFPMDAKLPRDAKFPVDAQFPFGKVSADSGQAAFACIKRVTELALNKEVDAIATTPINKEAIKAAKIDFIGHTEMLAGLTNTEDPLTMFQVEAMRVFFLSRHVSLKDACDLVTRERLLSYIPRVVRAMKMLGIKDGRCEKGRDGLLAVAGLNPHNGEHGLFGDVEETDIRPACEEARANGFNVVGPIPPDSVFHQARIGRYDAVLSLYHDQGHIATKTVDFERTISLTIGLPFLRTSVDHGTAFDIAGTGKASGISMEEAILVAAGYAEHYNS